MCVVQLGLGHTNHVREPTLATVLQAKSIHQISAGRCHSAAWTAPCAPPRAPGQSHSPVETPRPVLCECFCLFTGSGDTFYTQATSADVVLLKLFLYQTVQHDWGNVFYNIKVLMIKTRARPIFSMVNILG